MGDVNFLEECFHVVCKDCLLEAIKVSYPEVKCPHEECDKHL